MPRIDSKDLTVAFEETHSETPRGAAIVLTAILEAALEDCMCARLLPDPMSNTHRETLFGGESHFSSFSAKIDLGYSLGLYGPKTKADLHRIRAIRNQFAHYSPRSFSHEKVIKHCRDLTDYVPSHLVYKAPEPEIEKHLAEAVEFNMRWRFIHCVHKIGVDLWDEVKQKHLPPKPTVLP
jgi:hypothetical protein